LSAGGGSIKETGGPNKFIGSESHNSIWNTEKLAELKQSKDNKEKTTEEKQSITNVRASMRKERIDAMVEGIKSGEQRKDATVASIDSSDGQSYHAPTRGISIFDSAEFERVPEKTDGEKSADSARKPKEKDESWKELHRPMSSKDIVNNLFEKLTGEKSNE
jgi:hypothetical protein